MRNHLRGGTRRLAALALLVASGALGACAGDMGDVNTVQPGYVTKADLLGKTWYYRRTVVDTPESARGPWGEFGDWVTIGMGDLFTIERVRFEIQENHLIGYRDYEFVPGGEEREYEGGADAYKGAPVVAFPISSHFDIVYEYNPATGERTNVIGENATDRPWYDRDFMRVDWGGTQVKNNPFILDMEWIESGTPEYVHENDADNPFRARIRPESGHFDFVANHFVMPDIFTCYYDFDFSMFDITSCGGGEIKVRHSFMELDWDRESGYQPLEYPDNVILKDADGNEILDPETAEVMREPIFERFGFYRLERLTYDDVRGLTESGRLFRIIRFDIWDRAINANGDTIPYAERDVRPIEYWLNWDFPADLKETAFEVAADWNRTFRAVVASLKHIDFENIDDVPLTEVPDVFVLHENSCSQENLETYLNNHPEIDAKVRPTLDHETAVDALLLKNRPWLELGTNLEAPRKITPDTVDNWCSATEYFSEGTDEPFTWEQMGDPRTSMMYWVTQVVPAAFSGYGPMLGDPVTGRNVVSSAYVLGYTIDRAAARAVEYLDYMNDELPLYDLLVGANLPEYYMDGTFDPAAQREREGVLGYRASKQSSKEDLAELERRFKRQGQSFDEMMVEIENSRHFDERLDRLAGTDFEREYMIRDEDLVVASRGQWRPGQPVADDLWNAAAFTRRNRKLIDKQEATKRFLEEHAMCPVPMAELDGALLGLAKTLKGKSHEEKFQQLRKSIFKAVMLHEVGHNVGLRHNFEGSYDALNYDRTFWDLEVQHGFGTPEVERFKEEASQGEYKYSSIMDYHGKINGDFRGLGLYDRAAMKFGYGQLVERFADDSVMGGKDLEKFMFDNDYRDLMFEDGDGIGAQGQAYFASVDQLYDRRDFSFDWTQPVTSEVLDELDREVPYGFCSDEYAQWTPTCQRFDFGANPREQQETQQVRYKNYFIFSNFLRNRLVLDFSGTAMRAYATFGDTINTYQWLYYYRARDPEFANTDYFADLAQATAKGLNLMKEVIAMPRPDTYYRCVGNQVDDVTYYTSGYLDYDPVEDALNAIGPEGEACDMSQQVGLGIPQTLPLFFGFSDEYINWAFTYLGVYWDKLTAIDMMTYPLASFPRTEQFSDLRSYSISLYRLYHQEVNDILLGLIEFDNKSLASSINTAEGIVIPESKFPGAPDEVGMQADGKIVPALARNLQLNSLVYGMAYLTSPFDESLDFAKHTKVVQKGASDDFFDEAGYTNVVECQLPESGITYRAVPTESATDTSGRTDIAYNFVQKCAGFAVERALRLDEYDAEKAALANLPAGSPEALLQSLVVDDARREYELADVRLRQTEQVLIWMRQLNRFYEFGVGY